MPNGMWIPMVAADVARVDGLREIAKGIVAATGKPIHLVRFSHRTEVSKILP